MRLMKKAVGAAVALALSVSMLVGCGSTASSTASSVASSAAESVASSAVSEAASEVDENEAAATQLLKDLTGSYQELWPVILADDYTQTWLDDCTALVGEDNAQAAFDKLFSHTYHYIGMEPVRGLYGHIVQQGKHKDLINQPGIYADFVGGRKQAAGWKL